MYWDVVFLRESWPMHFLFPLKPRGRYVTEAAFAFALLTQQPRAQILAKTSEIFFFSILLSSWTVLKDRTHLLVLAKAKDVANAVCGKGQSWKNHYKNFKTWFKTCVRGRFNRSILTYTEVGIKLKLFWWKMSEETFDGLNKTPQTIIGNLEPIKKVLLDFARVRLLEWSIAEYRS